MRFEPAKNRGQPTAVWISQWVTFRGRGIHGAGAGRRSSSPADRPLKITDVSGHGGGQATSTTMASRRGDPRCRAAVDGTDGSADRHRWGYPGRTMWRSRTSEALDIEQRRGHQGRRWPSRATARRAGTASVHITTKKKESTAQHIGGRTGGADLSCVDGVLRPAATKLSDILDEEIAHVWSAGGRSAMRRYGRPRQERSAAGRFDQKRSRLIETSSAADGPRGGTMQVMRPSPTSRCNPRVPD